MQPKATLHIDRKLWLGMTEELHRRTDGRHESGAFLLGKSIGTQRRVSSVVFYDDLEAEAYDTGICILGAQAFSRLWDHCARHDCSVVADVHVHFLGAVQSGSDRTNPMIARQGHIALILPRMAKPPVRRWSVGIYEYAGDHQWYSHGGRYGSQVLKIEDNP